MNNHDITIVQIENDVTVYGLRHPTNDTKQSKAIPMLSKKYYEQSNQNPKQSFPFYVISKDYDESTTEFDLFIAGSNAFEGAAEILIPKGSYAIITIKPKFKYLWGLAIGEAKMFFYTKWLPNSRYKGLNMEYELHTIKSTEKNPTIDLYFAIS